MRNIKGSTYYRDEFRFKVCKQNVNLEQCLQSYPRISKICPDQLRSTQIPQINTYEPRPTNCIQVKSNATKCNKIHQSATKENQVQPSVTK